jgi:hypothetical protein
MKRGASWLGLLVGGAILLLQAWLAIMARLGAGDTLIGALVYFFTFFTILTNLMLVLIYASDLWPRAALAWWRSAVTRGMMAAVMVLVMVFYHIMLRSIWNPQGLALLCDVVLHYVAPILYVAWWVLFAPHGRLKFGHIPAMLLPPTIYLVWAMLRGAIAGEYPYPILEANRIGYGAVAVNVLVVLVGLTALCALVVALDRLLTRIDMPGP